MKLFKNRDHMGDGKGSDKAAGWIANSITTIQKGWAESMGKLFNKLSPVSRKVVLITSCLFMAGYSTALIAYSFNKAGSVLTKPTAIIQPLAISKPDRNVPLTIPSFIKRIERFKAYLDSLSKTDDGRRIRDSLLLRRPGLLDSIRRIETIYCSKQ